MNGFLERKIKVLSRWIRKLFIFACIVAFLFFTQVALWHIFRDWPVYDSLKPRFSSYSAFIISFFFVYRVVPNVAPNLNSSKLKLLRPATCFALFFLLLASFFFFEFLGEMLNYAFHWSSVYVLFGLDALFIIAIVWIIYGRS